MKKMPCLFQRSQLPNGRQSDTVICLVTLGCEWVINGEGYASRKFDGTACMVRNGQLYRRYDAKRGKTPPAGFEPCGEPDAVTGHHPGWLAVGDGPQDQWHREAWALEGMYLDNGTYELIGPKLQGNPEAPYLRSLGICGHMFIRHGLIPLKPPRDFHGLQEWLATHPVEGVVFRHDDGRMAKIRRKDYGYTWPLPCPRDTNGDGNCGQPLCPNCGSDNEGGG